MKDQELKELAKIAASPCEMYCDGECADYNDCTKCSIALKAAEAIQAAGYRKIYDDYAKQCLCYLLGCQEGEKIKTQVAREIFEEIEKSIASLEYRVDTPRKTVKVEELKGECDWIIHDAMPKILAELKKKYTEGEV